MYDTLLFLHVLAAFALAAAVVMFCGFTLGLQPSSAGFSLASRLEDIGGTGTILLGIWLALDVEGYSLLDGWIIAALLLWLAAGGVGNAYRNAAAPALAGSGGMAAGVAQRVALLNWVRAVLFVALLADMVWKPGA